MGHGALAIALGVAVMSTAAAGTGAAGGPPGQGGRASRLEITVLSGAPDQVSGGDALVQVTVPRRVSTDDVAIELDGTDVTAAIADRGDGSLVGLVEGLADGENTLRAEADGGRGRPRAAELTLLNHPTGGPIFSGPQQQPFVCTTARGRFDGRPLLDQPLV
ncbi:MAG: DUF6351 family protein, partial [Acidimicrobiales bacterium]